MRRLSRFFASASAVSVMVLLAEPALAQGDPPPLPPPSTPNPQAPQLQPPPNQYQPPPQPYQQQPQYQQPQYYQQPPPYQPEPQYQQPPPREAPPPVDYVEPEVPAHAPKFSLWVGGRLGYMGFGFSWYRNEDGKSESTGNLVGNGLAPEVDVGARISHRYIPYLFWEHGFLSPGHRFDGEKDASGSTDFYGVGFRFHSGDVSSVSFVSDLAIGQRVVTVSNGGQTYKMSGLEYFRLGLGADIRVMTLFTIEPLLSISTGSLNDTQGTVTYAPNQGDGATHPRFQNGSTIDDERRYVMLSLGVGVHFDIFGK
jgi:hypothetical protein